MTNTLLQVLPSIIRTVDSDLEIDADFCESLRLYLENFDRVIIACPITTEITDSGLRRCRPVRELPWQSRMKIIPLPNAYHFVEFLRHYQAVRRLLRAEIEKADYLLFSPHGLVGDWPTVAVREAIKLRRPYVIDADVVYDDVAHVGRARGSSWKSAVKKNIMLPLLRQSYRRCVVHSSLALLQGQDVYDAYAPFAHNPHKVYHMPISKEEYVTDAQLETKLNDLVEGRPLTLCYVGRAIDMKGPMDWLKALHKLVKSDLVMRAVWLGDGSLLPNMQATAEKLGISDSVTFAGYVSDRNQILRTLKESDIFLFCHKTRESPRCLVEALACGCPLVGYGSAYPKEIVAQRGGGRFSTVGDWNGLADIVQDLDKNREKLCALTREASASGRLYERDSTMQRRIDLIKQYLRPNQNDFSAADDVRNVATALEGQSTSIAAENRTGS
jgi:glycosyltransferase involved in cell wall biosynthesis